MTRTRIIIALIILLVALALLLGPCVLTSNPFEPSVPDEPAAADSTGP
jgi:hypothetical protein